MFKRLFSGSRMTRECHVRFCEKLSGFAGGFTHQKQVSYAVLGAIFVCAWWNTGNAMHVSKAIRILPQIAHLSRHVHFVLPDYKILKIPARPGSFSENRFPKTYYVKEIAKLIAEEERGRRERVLAEQGAVASMKMFTQCRCVRAETYKKLMLDTVFSTRSASFQAVKADFDKKSAVEREHCATEIFDKAFRVLINQQGYVSSHKTLLSEFVGFFTIALDIILKSDKDAPADNVSLWDAIFEVWMPKDEPKNCRCTFFCLPVMQTKEE